MTKVLIISEEGRGGGPLQRIYNMARLTREEIKTVVVCPKNSNFQKLLSEAGIKNYGIGLSSLSKQPIALLKYLVFFWLEIIAICRVIRLEKPDLIHVASSTQIKGLIAGKIMGQKVLWQMNDSYQPGIVKRLFKWISGLPDAYILTSVRAKEYYSAIAPTILDKTHWIFQSPVDVQHLAPANPHTMTAPYRLILIGYINAHKGIELLIKSLSRLDNQHVMVDIAGPVLDSQKTYYQGLLSQQAKLNVDNLNFLGYQKIDAHFLDQYQFCLCTSLREASPTAVWECMANGLPIISTDVGDVHHFIDEYHCGIKINTFDPGAVADSIRTAVSLSQDEYLTLSKGAQQAARENFDQHKIASNYISCYRTISSDK